MTPQTSLPAAASATAVDARSARIATLYQEGIRALQEAFDPARHLVFQHAAANPAQRTYRQSVSPPLAYALLARNEAEADTEAFAIIEAVLESQEMSPHHPHYGNWLWLADDADVADLNAVQFVMRTLLPVLVDFGDRLPAPLRALCQTRVRLALEEEARIDVAPTYTNIHLMSLFALLVGGQWLDDLQFSALGKARWARWVHFTVESGAPHEYNSPGYGGIDLLTLGLIVQYTTDPAIQTQAKLLYERLWLHLLLHIHRPTGQQSAPHCRCYWGQMQSGRTGVKDLLWRETGAEWLLEAGPYGGSSGVPEGLELAVSNLPMPNYLGPWLARQVEAMPYEVREIANRDAGFDLTTYFTPSYALGTASRTYGIGTDCFYIEHQANYLMLHYTRPKSQGGWGMVYSRYVVNDRHWGTLAAAPDRPKTNNFYDQGHFAGVQLHNKAIGLYALKPQHEEVFSLKTVVAFPSGNDLTQVWIDDQPVDLAAPLPALQVGQWLIVEDGDVRVGVYPLQPSPLGRETPILLERGPQAELWLTIYNYRGAPKRFWDYASLQGAFWRGNLRAGYVLEVTERSDFPDAAALLAHLRASQIHDHVDAQHLRTVSYASGDESLTLQYDLWQTEPVARVLNGQRYDPPNLASPLAVQGATGDLRVGGARLQTLPQQVWLVAQELEAAQRVWVAVNPLDRPTPLRLETPLGVVSAEEWGLGRVAWHAPEGGEQVLYLSGLAQPRALSTPEGLRVVWGEEA